MKIKYNMTKSLLQTIKQFYENEQGVYVVMTALLAFPLLFLIAFTVDGTGALLDRVRLAQATDQAALLLTTEDNANRDHKRDGNKHKDLITQDVSKEREEARKNGSSFNILEAQVKKRNQQLVQGLVKLYLRSDDSLTSKNSSPITIPSDFLAECKENTNNLDPNGKGQDIACTVQGTVHRKFILPWSHSLVTSDQLKDGRLAVNSGQAYAIKEKQITIPIDLMMVTDLSGSMEWYINSERTAPYPHRRIDALVDVVGEIQNILLPKSNKGNVSPYNRIGFVSFAAGARQKGDTTGCVLPYYVQQPRKIREISNLLNSHRIRTGFDELERYMDRQKTVNQIRQFENGKNQSYDFTFDNGEVCLGGNGGKETTQTWFDKDNTDVAKALGKIKPLGGTAVTSGMLIGTNLMTNKNSDPEATPSKLNTNTRRVLLILSDGEDNRPSKNTLVNLMRAGLCREIKAKINSLQDSNYAQVEARVAFIAFGTKLPNDQLREWKGCVGEHYYPVFSKQGLLDAFKQIISFEEEVGRSSSQKPKLFQ
ncbi:pilus assembly protein [Aggregatibacter actinomycetemcomitans]|nr:pilus assembly protein [Aggregatibacter actinomycetemcomitans]